MDEVNRAMLEFHIPAEHEDEFYKVMNEHFSEQDYFDLYAIYGYDYVYNPLDFDDVQYKGVTDV